MYTAETACSHRCNVCGRWLTVARTSVVAYNGDASAADSLAQFEEGVFAPPRGCPPSRVAVRPVPSSSDIKSAICARSMWWRPLGSRWWRKIGSRRSPAKRRRVRGGRCTTSSVAGDSSTPPRQTRTVSAMQELHDVSRVLFAAPDAPSTPLSSSSSQPRSPVGILKNRFVNMEGHDMLADELCESWSWTFLSWTCSSSTHM